VATETMLGLFAGAAGLGALHGAEPGHGWPVAAAWALARPHRRSAGIAAATVIGVGHLVSSIAVVAVFFAAKEWLALGETAWIDWVAGALLLVLAAWQGGSALAAHSHGHHHHHDDRGAPAATTGLGGLAVFAFTLGFAHEEEFQIIALCAGSEHCLALMLTYALAVIAALIVLTLVLIAGLHHFQHRVEQAQHHLTLASAAILALMGVGFLTGVL